MGLDMREKVHEIEFLSILAFIARERQRIKLESLPNSKFSHNDLQIAYAFQNQFGVSREARQRDRVDAGRDQRLVSSLVAISPDSSFDAPLRLQQNFSDTPLQSCQPAVTVEQATESSTFAQPTLNLAQTPSANLLDTGRKMPQLASSLDGIEQALMGECDDSIQRSLAYMVANWELCLILLPIRRFVSVGCS